MEILVNGYAYPTIDPEILKDWAPSLSLLSCFSYGFTENGDLIPLDDYEMREIVSTDGVKSMMVLTAMNSQGNFSNELARTLLEDTEMQGKLILQIRDEMLSKNLFGVNFDFEYVLPENKEAYVSFIANATNVLNKDGFIVTVALAPKTSSDQQGLLYEGIDYAGLGSAANFAIVMTYEWGYTYGPPMAVAPLPSVRNVLIYAMSQIPPDKILMGIPNYGYDWALPYIRGTTRARKISNYEATLLSRRYNVPIIYDAVSQSPHFNYIDENGIEHEVWFEDYTSWTAKFQLLKELELAGISIWNLMSYFEGGTQAINENFVVAKV